MTYQRKPTRKELIKYAEILIYEDNLTPFSAKHEMMHKGVEWDLAEEIIEEVQKKEDWKVKRKGILYSILGVIILVVGVMMTKKSADTVYTGMIAVGLILSVRGLITFLSRD